MEPKWTDEDMVAFVEFVDEVSCYRLDYLTEWIKDILETFKQSLEAQ